jgi:D-beta-D-heptose 7-phosphate kinase/D-beta-D-heptose 1-phosphate adenosyltransferase
MQTFWSHGTIRTPPKLSRDKLKDAADAGESAAYWRQNKERIVFTNGCFDILHEGHIALIEEARSQGDRLIVGLNSDASVKRLKGDSRPIFSEKARAIVLGALEAVDTIIIFDADTPAELIEIIKPDVLVKGSDWRGKAVAGQTFVESYGGRMHYVETLADRSTTLTIEKCRGANIQ